MRWFVVAAVVLCVIAPACAGQEESKRPSQVGQSEQEGPDSGELTDGQKTAIVRLEVLTYLLFLAWGLTFGSFLNAVIYRLPAGLPLMARSKCPQCEGRIALKDNIPVISWLRLRAKCRSCRVAIPARYPIVEAVVGMFFLALLHFELVSGGKNLPVRPENFHAGVLWIIWYTKWDLIGIYLFHCVLGCLLIAAALMQWDGHPVARSLTRFGLAVGIAAPVFWQHLHPVSFHEPRMMWLTERLRWEVPFEDPVKPGWILHFGVGLDAVPDSLAGLACGLMTGWLVTMCVGTGAFLCQQESTDTTPDHLTKRDRNGFIAMFGIAGTFLGWQSIGPLAIGVGLLLLLFAAVATATGDSRWRRRTSGLSLGLGTCTLLLFWRGLTDQPWLPGHTGWPILTRHFPAAAEPYVGLVLAVGVGSAIAASSRLTQNRQPSA